MNPPFAVQKIGHAVLNVADLEKSKHFYTEVLGFRVSDWRDDTFAFVRWGFGSTTKLTVW